MSHYSVSLFFRKANHPVSSHWLGWGNLHGENQLWSPARCKSPADYDLFQEEQLPNWESIVFHSFFKPKLLSKGWAGSVEILTPFMWKLSLDSS